MRLRSPSLSRRKRRKLTPRQSRRSKVRAGGTVKQAIFNFAFTAKKYGPTIVGHIMDAVVFKAVKQATGGSLEYAVNGGAPISEATHDFLTTTLVKNFIAGYGELQLLSKVSVLLVLTYVSPQV